MCVPILTSQLALPLQVSSTVYWALIQTRYLDNHSTPCHKSLKVSIGTYGDTCEACPENVRRALLMKTKR